MLRLSVPRRRPAGPCRRALVAILACVVAGIAATIGWAGTASAHAQLLSANPPAGAVLASSPTEVALQFSEPVDILDGAIRLFAADGTQIDLPRATTAGGGTSVVAAVPALQNGTYVVAWRVVSADSHPISGAHSFSVGQPSETDPGLVESLLAEGERDPGTQALLGVGRWISFGALALVVGLFTVLVVFDRASLATRRVGRILTVGAAVGAAGTALMIAAQAAVTGGSALSFGDWRAVLESSAGRWWGVRIAFFAAAAAIVPIRRRVDRAGGLAGPLLIVGVAFLGVVAAGGHAITGRWVPVGVAATMIHLAAMCLWVGGLVALAVVVPGARRLEVAGSVSRLAFASVVLLAITGAVSGWRQSESWSALVHSPYGRWLFLKLAVVAAVCVVAGVSRRLVRSGSAAGTDAERRDRLRRLVGIEVAGIVVVLAATAGIADSAPPKQDPLAPTTISIVDGTRLAQIIVDPPVTGGTSMHVTLSSTSGALVRPRELAVSASLPERDIVSLDLPLAQIAPGHLAGDDVDLPLPGRWTISVVVRYSEFDQATFVAEVDIRRR